MGDQYTQLGPSTNRFLGLSDPLMRAYYSDPKCESVILPTLGLGHTEKIIRHQVQMDIDILQDQSRINNEVAGVGGPVQIGIVSKNGIEQIV